MAGAARKVAKVPYPNTYATHEEAQKDLAKYRFNCAQRAHANYIENLTVVLPLMIVAGIQYPVTTAALGGIWSVGRVFFALGYKAGKQGDNGKGRYKGVFYTIGQAGLIVTTGLSLYSVFCSKQGGW